jgi:hypothetical protein
MLRLIAGAIALALAACTSPSASVAPTSAVASPGTSVAGSPLPSGSLPSASVAPSLEPSASPGPPSAFQVLPPGSAVEVRVAELNLRRNPTTSARRVELLERGDLLVISPSDFVIAGYGPIKADGYTWYPVIKIDVFDGDGELDPLPTHPIPIGAELVSGWIATDDGEDRFVRQLNPRCPTTVDLTNVSGMLPAERLACFGGGPITLEGTFGCGGCGGAIAGVFEPAWLASPMNFDFLSEDVSEQFGPLALRFRPSGPAAPTPGSIIRVTVHVDDARSTRCRIQEAGDGDTLVPVDPATAALFCREQLVVDSYEVLGMDPDFTGG